jgi:hypothetical protein
LPRVSVLGGAAHPQTFANFHHHRHKQKKIIMAVFTCLVAGATYRMAKNVSDNSTAGQLLGGFAKAGAAGHFKCPTTAYWAHSISVFNELKKAAIDAGRVNSCIVAKVAVGVMTDPGVCNVPLSAPPNIAWCPLSFVAFGVWSPYTT